MLRARARWPGPRLPLTPIEVALPFVVFDGWDHDMGLKLTPSQHRGYRP